MTKDIFDSNLLGQKRAKFVSKWDKSDFLWTYMAKNVCDRVHDTLRDYDNALDIGTRKMYIPRAFKQKDKVKHWDTQEAFALDEPYTASIIAPITTIKPHSYDLLTSLLNLHNINNIQSELQIYNQLLKPGGLLIANLFGEENLKELRKALYQAEMEVLGGISPRISPNITLKDAGNLLFMAGFKLPVADKESLTINYKSPLKFLKDIQYMGESNSLINRLKTPKKPKAFIAALCHYLQEIAGGDDGSINISVEIITLTGWKSDGTMNPKTTPNAPFEWML
ncbi:MAG: hypothetical protein ACK5MJ_08135 [Alphaproteobacteria bacterium]